MPSVADAAPGAEGDAAPSRTHCDPRPQPRDPIAFADVFREERDAIGVSTTDVAFRDLEALCLSGGGIRSAALCLGVLQGLARRGLLDQFHFLSTVSGGGFIGGFLTACIAARSREGHPDKERSLEKVVELLARTSATEFPELAALRKYTNYLTPNPGLASPDTWAGILLWLRNTLVNWTVFLPLMLGLSALPLFYLATLGIAASVPNQGGQILSLVFALSALGCLAFAIANIVVALPSHEHPDRLGDAVEPDRRVGAGFRSLFWRVIVMATGWSVLAPLAAVSALHVPEAGRGAHDALWSLWPTTAVVDPVWHWIVALPIASLVISVIAFRYAEWAVDITYVDRPNRPSGPFTLLAFGHDCLFGMKRPLIEIDDVESADRRDANRNAHRVSFKLNRWHWAFSSALSAAFLGLGLWLATGLSLVWVSLAGPLWMIVGETVRVSLYVALRRAALRGDLDREWLGRLNGIQLGGAIVLCVLGIAALFLPTLLHEKGAGWWTAIVGGGLASGSLTAGLGRSVLTVFARGGEEGKPKVPLKALLYLGIILFAAALLVVSGTLVRQVALAPLADGPLRIAALTVIFVIGGLIGLESLKQAFRRLGSWGRLPQDFHPSGKAAVATYRCRAISAALVLFGTVLLTLTVADAYVMFGGGLSAVPPSSLQYYVVGAVSVLLTIGGIALALFLGRQIDLNTFSMHAVYRNRLVRAFLGTARESGERRPDRFTSFDPTDDIRVHDTFMRKKLRLFPVVNAALNRTSGKDTARAERKAEIFTITPLHCGSAPLRRRKKCDGCSYVWDEAAPRDGAYVDTCRFAGGGRETGPGDAQLGITLGTAMTLSGAAASPNMGYNSSPLVAFLMTLFNVRLGGWLPNPAGERGNLWRAGPKNAVPTLLSELGGRSDDRSDFVYLSDGGHADNLGLVEMLRRRCDRILVVDAGQDAEYAYSDLGSALQHARIDLGIEVTFLRPVDPRDPKLPSAGAFATVHYPETKIGGTLFPEKKGQLLLLKSWLPRNAPTDVRAFQALKRQFPHDSTLGNQFFTESDFESYRRLGEFLLETAYDAAELSAAVGKPPNPVSLKVLFAALDAKLTGPPPGTAAYPGCDPETIGRLCRLLKARAERKDARRGAPPAMPPVMAAPAAPPPSPGPGPENGLPADPRAGRAPPPGRGAGR